ncbi:zinc finger protein 585A-like [Morone saxatilis]|uniref:zinc finger protein 585A-like n=1 Tax=Morone saxatilis TaxID=34816 RepID=UPI0015E2291C|nr:zinc finger protein 585A-like [Morone saxatilis]
MSACCVSGCKNRRSSTSKLKLYRIPSGYRPFQANRRRLWLQAIREVNGSTGELKANARVCGAHFISGEASMDHDSPDFVPSVFTSTEHSVSAKKKAKWFYGRRKKRRRTADAETNRRTSPAQVDSPADLQSCVLMEKTETPSSPSGPKEGETETESKTIKSQTTSSPHKAEPSFKVPAGIPKLNKSAIVLLKPVFVPAGGYLCELCNRKFTNASQLVKHKQLHEEKRSFICEICGKLFTSHADLTECVHEPSFPCNMCDRSFTSSHYLKRHKLLHVKDGRKCGRCGVLFCQRHNHILYLPQTESEQDSSIIEPQDLGSNVMPENAPLESAQPDETADLDDDAQNAMTVTPLETTASPAPPNAVSKTRNALPPASYTRILSEIPKPVLIKPSPVKRQPPPVPRYSRKDYLATHVQPHLPQHPELPPSLNMFSPQYLTSALLEVKRNYDYILSKPRVVKKKEVDIVKVDIVKEEQCELLLIPPDEKSVEHIKQERTAYDLEIVL